MKEAVSNDFAAMMFCPSCRSKLAVPLEMLDGSNISCPRCEASFLPETESLMAEDSSGIFDEEETGAGEEKRIFEDGAFFDKYKIIKILGKGGMAEVYLAEHLLLKQLCALKLMRPSLYDSNPRFIKRFIREAKITHRIKHPNIVSVFDVGSDQKTGYLFIAMEFLDGKSLLETSRDRLLSERDLLDMALSMTSALSVLEKEKVVHRDIKPSNIMFCKNGTLKLMDLGVAKAESGSMEGEITLTVEQTSIGTPSYASPEQCECAHNVDTRSDIYCLGATLYHAASGHVPFGGGTPFEIMLKVLREEPVPLVRYRSDLSRHFLALINDMMQKDPNKRPSSAAVLEKRVKECIAYLENPASVQALSLLPPLGLNNEKSIKEPERKNTHYPALAPHLPDNASGNGAFSHTLADLPPPAVEEDEIELPGIKMSGSASNSSTILPKMIFAGENESSSVKMDHILVTPNATGTTNYYLAGDESATKKADGTGDAANAILADSYGTPYALSSGTFAPAKEGETSKYYAYNFYPTTTAPIFKLCLNVTKATGATDEIPTTQYAIIKNYTYGTNAPAGKNEGDAVVFEKGYIYTITALELNADNIQIDEEGTDLAFALTAIVTRAQWTPLAINATWD